MSLLTACLALVAAAAPTAAYDVVIRGGRVVDGTGNAWVRADVGIRATRIVTVGRLEGAAASTVIDATGKIVAPGFIDVHTHIEDGVLVRPAAENFVADGVTTVVTGNCGGSRGDLPEFFRQLGAAGISINVASLVGHNTVRRQVLGSAQRDPSSAEQQKMESLVAEAMRAGAVGLSTGLIYIPGTYAATPEIVGLARAAAAHGGVYVSHIRSEGDEVFAAIEEALEIGRQAAVPVQISHFKISNKRLWGQSRRTLGLVEAARTAGLDVTLDQYSYTASSTNLGVLLPSWALADGAEATRARLRDAATRRKIAAEMRDTIFRRNGRKRLDYAVVARCEWDRALEGKNIAAIARERRRPPTLASDVETVLEMMEQGGVQMIYHSMDERDVEAIMRWPHTMIASDGGVMVPEVGVPHPRSYGTNARVLGRYVRDRKVLRLEDAIRKMTSLPAQRFHLADRGLLRPGAFADVVVLDPAGVTDRATFDRPHALSHGFTAVLVNGALTWDGTRHTGARSGQVLRGAAASDREATGSR